MSRRDVQTAPAVTQAPGPRGEAPWAGGVTWRAVLLSFLLLLGVALLNFYVELTWGINWSWSWMFSSGVPAAVPVVILFVLAAIGSMPLFRRAGLTRRELLVVYSVVLVGAPVLTHGVLAWMLVKNVAYYYSARVQTHWETMFLSHVPTWWAPTDPAAVDGFFEGQTSVPWSLWAVPLLAWGAFAIALFVCSLCVMVIIQRQWITSERLTFPIAQIPLEMISGAQPARAGSPGRLTGAWLFWLGLVLAFGVNFVSSLSAKIPAIPTVPLVLDNVIPWQRVGPLAGLGGLTVILWPWMIAVAYLIPKELSFSVWFFSLVRFALTVLAIALGATPMRPEDWWSTSFPAPYYQGGGAVVALSVWVLWIARRHLRRALRLALVRGPRPQDAHEPLSYRWAFIGLALAFLFMVWFFWRSGCRATFGIALVLLTVGYFSIWARLRAETGLGFLCFPIQIQDVLWVPVGTSAFRVAELVTMVTMRWAYTPGFDNSFEVFPGAALETFKIADSAGINARRLTYALIGGFVLSLAAGILVFMLGVYHFGWLGLSCSRGGWLGPQSLGDGGRIVAFLTDPSVAKTDVNGLVALLVGAAVVVFLGLMRLRFWWWPFHPVGYLASNTWGFHWWYIPFFIGWAAKSLVVRYGGLRLYRTTLPLAIGMIVGDLLNGGVWAAVRVITQGRV